jgi:hypothetical protein
MVGLPRLEAQLFMQSHRVFFPILVLLCLCPAFGETAPWQDGIILSVEISSAYTEVAVAVSDTLYVCRPLDTGKMSQFLAGAAGRKYNYARVNARDVRAGAKAQMAFLSDGTAWLRSERGLEYLSEVVSQRYYPTQSGSETKEQQAQSRAAPTQSNSDPMPTKKAEPESERPTPQRNVAPPTGSQEKVLLVQNSGFVELDALEARQRDTNGSRIYSVPGKAATARTHSSRPAFLVPTDLARDLELYQLEVADDSRIMVFSVKGQQVAFPTAITIETVSEGVSRVSPSVDLAPGEYALSPKTSNASFLFGID